MIVVDKKQHLQATVTKPVNCDAFKNRPIIPLSTDEITQTVALMPMAFKRRADHWQLVGITSVTQEQNQFIGGKGQWVGYYRPKVLDLSPLAVTPAGGEQQALTLFVDEVSSCWHPTGGEGQQLFDDNAEQTPFLTQCMSELKRSHLLSLKLNDALNYAVEQDAIVPWQPGGIAWLGEQGLYRASPEWLGGMVNNDERVAAWLFKLMLAQQFSMAGMNRLRRAAANLARQSEARMKARGLEGFSLSSSEIELDFSNFDDAD